MLVLAVDTATPAITAGLVVLDADGQPRTRAQRVTVNARAHGELLIPQIREVLAEAGVGLSDVDAIVCGTGPGPFTGLRVGMVTAAALGDGANRPVYPVCTLDAIAVDATHPLLVVTDARRREVYWAAYDADGRRTTGPHVQRPAEVAELLPELGVTAMAGQATEIYGEVLGLPAVPPLYPSPAGLVSVAADELRASRSPEPLVPLYLRRPDAQEPHAPKAVRA